jgi:hypothetical protein
MVEHSTHDGFPRITKAYVSSLIIDEQVRYIVETRTTVCSVRLVNGRTVTETATCGWDKQFDPIKGRTVARKKVLDKIIDYEQYLHCQRIYEANCPKEISHV